MGERVERPAQLVRLAAAVAVGVFLTFAAGCGSGDAGDGETSASAGSGRRDPYAYARARFNEMCAGCHTLADARATGRRFNLDNVPTISRARTRQVIAGGEHGMPPFRETLSRREFEELARYVFAVARGDEGDDYWGWQMRLRREGGRTEPILPDRPDTALAETSGVDRQRAIFRTRCGGCHTLQDAGATGTAAGEEHDLDAIRPNRSTVEFYVKNGYRRMRSFRGELSPRQIGELARYVADADGCGSRDPMACTAESE